LNTLLGVWKLSPGSIPGRVKSKTGKLTLVAGCVHHLRTRAGLVAGLVGLCQYIVSGWGILFISSWGIVLRYVGTLKSDLSQDQLQ